MGSGSSSESIGNELKKGGEMFQQRPMHERSMSHEQVDQGIINEEFIDVSYSDLGGIVSPQVSLTIIYFLIPFLQSLCRVISLIESLCRVLKLFC